MALPTGKIAFIVGAGLLGSILVKEGQMSTISDFFSGAFKIAFHHIQRDNPSSNTSKPRNDSLLAQVNSLREELQMLASSRSITIVTQSRSVGASTYVPVVVVVGVVGYGYVWWKGWKLSDMMFATRKSLSDACLSVGKQLEQVQSSITASRKHLTLRINHVDSNIEECAELNIATRNEVVELRGDLKVFGVDVESVHRAVQALEDKIGRIEGKQDLTNQGVYQLCNFVQKHEENRSATRIQASSSSSRAAIELPPTTPPSRGESLPTKLPQLECPSSANASPKQVLRPVQTSVSVSGLKDLQGISSIIDIAKTDELNRICITRESNSNDRTSGRFSWKIPKLTSSFLTRTNSAS